MSNLDTLSIYEELVDKGIKPEEAKAQVHAMFKMMNINTYGLATKEDLRQLELVTKQDIMGISKDIFYMKLMMGGMFAIGCIPIIQQYLKG